MIPRQNKPTQISQSEGGFRDQNPPSESHFYRNGRLLVAL